MKRALLYLTIASLFLPHISTKAQGLWGLANSRTETRNDAGLSGDNGATSGFFQTDDPTNYPGGASGWWHLLDIRHSVSANNYAMQLAGSFQDQNLYFRKTINTPSTYWSRVLLERDGKVGIGLTDPLHALDVIGTFQLRKLTGGVAANFSNYHDQDLQIQISAPDAIDKYSLITPSSPTSLAFGTQNIERMRLVNSGDFGIGTPNPQAKLDVVGNGSYHINMKVNGRIQTGDANNNGGVWLDAANSQFVGQYSASTMGIYTNNAWRMVVDNSGNLGIGTLNPQAKLDVDGNIFTTGKIAIGTTDLTKMGAYALSVNGDAIFQRVKVELYNTWPDYVFEPGYRPLPLTELESFVKRNKHLPEVPSASEIEKDGLDVGGNQAILLKKVEELTLYLIEQNKQQELTNEIVLDLNKKIERLQLISKSQANALKAQHQQLLQLKKQ